MSKLSDTIIRFALINKDGVVLYTGKTKKEVRQFKKDALYGYYDKCKIKKVAVNANDHTMIIEHEKDKVKKFLKVRNIRMSIKSKTMYKNKIIEILYKNANYDHLNECEIISYDQFEVITDEILESNKEVIRDIKDRINKLKFITDDKRLFNIMMKRGCKRKYHMGYIDGKERELEYLTELLKKLK